MTVCPGCKDGSYVTRRAAILCVDDEPNILALRSALLGMAGYKVHIAKDGRSGLEIFRNRPVDLVVLDYEMPGMMGDDVAQEMRRLRKDVPLLLVTAFHDLPATCTSMFDATVIKGESPTLLLEKITSLLPEHEPQLGVSRSPWKANGQKSVRVLLKTPAAERRK